MCTSVKPAAGDFNQTVFIIPHIHKIHIENSKEKSRQMDWDAEHTYATILMHSFYIPVFTCSILLSWISFRFRVYIPSSAPKIRYWSEAQTEKKLIRNKNNYDSLCYNSETYAILTPGVWVYPGTGTVYLQWTAIKHLRETSSHLKSREKDQHHVRRTRSTQVAMAFV